MECSYLKYALDPTAHAAAENPRWFEGEREFFTTSPFFHMLMLFPRYRGGAEFICAKANIEGFSELRNIN